AEEPMLEACDAVRVLNWSSREGAFATIDAPDFGTGPMLPTYFGSGLTLTVPPAGAACPNLALLGGGTATASSESSSPQYGADNAIDGVAAAYSSWCARSDDAAPAIAITFPTGAIVKSLHTSSAGIEGNDFLSGRFRLFDATGSVVYDS